MRRSYDAAEINPILNHPSVFPHIAVLGMTEIDVSPILADPHNVLLVGAGGGIFFVRIDACLYEVHTNFLKPDRASLSTEGPYIRNFCLEAYRFMFTHTDCLELNTKIPAHNRVGALAPLIGWQKEFERKACWPSVNDGMVDCAFYSIRYEDWLRKTPGLMETGRWFHERMREECARLGHPEERHADEDCHDLTVGACIETIMGGQLEKAIICYNKWARFAGYGAIALVSRSPLLIDIGDALIHVLDNDFRVIKCQSAQA